jgi:hypothetical protein
MTLSEGMGLSRGVGLINTYPSPPEQQAMSEQPSAQIIAFADLQQKERFNPITAFVAAGGISAILAQVLKWAV